MKARRGYILPEDKERLLRRAIRLEWISLFLTLTIVVAMYLTMGSSQAMKMALLEDLLAFVPPAVFLLAMRIRRRPPDESHPYGYSRAILLAFLAAAVAILMFGLFMLMDSLSSLIKREHPSIGHFQLFDWQYQIWGGWIMIAALVYAMILPVILGHLKMPLAEALHESTLYADADMNKADWMTAAAAIVGILGIGLGFWWADSLAAAVISLDVLKDGVTHVRKAMFNLMDQRPTETIGNKPLGLEDLIAETLLREPDILDAASRLREEGHIVGGEIFVVLAPGQANVARRVQEIAEQARALDWRLYDLIVMPVEVIER
ncbi:putative cation transport membrane protein [Pseudomonas saudimassiliensis]|uniref:Putative cation transport membrane protein n=1 Tax=Pseudomonas saudimassiliensis TaxID=1461581 RepID=A0A078MDL0_9PSED|nr:cation diffusion facilitator family transporter [Pseudomonas saudimassiliensis]CEA03537.1 putative cation transport membrane protein [Pseudomonas saudimassiliensis]CEF26222.1 putative cation transport membrane protein [Pseudomonas saudimassiliensis]